MASLTVNNTPPNGLNGGGSRLRWGCDDYDNTTAARYLPMCSSNGSATNIDRRSQIVVGAAFTLATLYAHSDALGGVNVTFTIYVNGVASAVTCTIAGGGTSASDNTHTASLVAGDVVTCQTVCSSASASTVSPSAACTVG